MKPVTTATEYVRSVFAFRSRSNDFSRSSISRTSPFRSAISLRDSPFWTICRATSNPCSFRTAIVPDQNAASSSIRLSMSGRWACCSVLSSVNTLTSPTFRLAASMFSVNARWMASSPVIR